MATSVGFRVSVLGLYSLLQPIASARAGDSVERGPGAVKTANQ